MTDRRGYVLNVSRDNYFFERAISKKSPDNYFPMSDFKARFVEEIEQAMDARASGNEGKARVCARRAVGHIIAEYLRIKGYPDLGPSMYKRMQFFINLPGLPSEVTSIASHFIVKVTPTRTLPIDADLIEEARWLARTLFPAEFLQ